MSSVYGEAQAWCSHWKVYLVSTQESGGREAFWALGVGAGVNPS